MKMSWVLGLFVTDGHVKKEYYNIYINDSKQSFHGESNLDILQTEFQAITSGQRSKRFNGVPLMMIWP